MARRSIIGKSRGRRGLLEARRAKLARLRSESSSAAPAEPPSKNGSSEPGGDFEPQEAPTRPVVPKPPIEQLIARSSLGTPGAVAVRVLAPATVLAEVVRRLDLPVAKLRPFDPARLNEPYDIAELDAVTQRLEQTGVLDEFEQEAQARARALRFAKDWVLIDWLDSEETLAADLQGHGATAPRAVSPGEILEGVTRGAVEQSIPTPEEVYQHFVDGLTEQTRVAYGEDLEHFARWLGQPNSRAAVIHLFRQSIMQANQLVLGWANAMRAEGYAPSTRSRRMSALRAAVKLANAFGVINWQLHVRSPKVQKVRDTRGVDPIDVRKMLAACENTKEGVRDRAIVLVLFTLGLRRVELVRLLVKHYDHVRRRLLVHGKGCERDPNKIKWRDLPADVDTVLNEWLLRGHGADPEPKAAIFFGWKNNHRTSSITPRGVHYVISRLGKRVGVDVWPHSFRHSAVTTGFKKGYQLHEMQQFARHESPVTTQIYNDDVDNAPRRVADTLAEVARSDEYLAKEVLLFAGLVENWCYYCGVTNKPLLLEHKTPRSRGGSDSNYNLVSACVSCNAMKSARTYKEFLELIRGRLADPNFVFVGEKIYCFVKPEEDPRPVGDIWEDNAAVELFR